MILSINSVFEINIWLFYHAVNFYKNYLELFNFFIIKRRLDLSLEIKYKISHNFKNKNNN